MAKFISLKEFYGFLSALLTPLNFFGWVGDCNRAEALAECGKVSKHSSCGWLCVCVHIFK